MALATSAVTEDEDDIRISRILDKLFDQYTSSEKFVHDLAEMFPNENRSLLMVIKCPKKTVYFGAQLLNGQIQKLQVEDFNLAKEGSVKALLDSTTFVRILVGYDERHTDIYGKPIPFDINYAWSTGDLKFEGKKVYVHRQILKGMFDEFHFLITGW